MKIRLNGFQLFVMAGYGGKSLWSQTAPQSLNPLYLKFEIGQDKNGDVREPKN